MLNDFLKCKQNIGIEISFWIIFILIKRVSITNLDNSGTYVGNFNLVVILLIYIVVYPTFINSTQCDLEIDLYESHGRGCTCLE